MCPNASLPIQEDCTVLLSTFLPKAITRILVRRYIHESKKTMRQGIVNEDDLLEIKQDISSLRYFYGKLVQFSPADLIA